MPKHRHVSIEPETLRATVVDFSLPPDSQCGLSFRNWLLGFAQEHGLPIALYPNDVAVQPVLDWIRQNHPDESNFLVWIDSLRIFVQHDRELINQCLTRGWPNRNYSTITNQRNYIAWVNLQLEVIDNYNAIP